MKLYIYDNPAAEDEEYAGYGNDFLYESGIVFIEKNLNSLLCE